MPHYLLEGERLARETRFVDRIFRLRLIGSAASGVSVAVTLLAHGNPYGWLIWLALALNSLLWPRLARGQARAARSPVRAEQRHLVIDGLYLGIWIAVIGCSPIPTTVLICALVAGRISAGEWRILASAMLMLGLGLILGWLSVGRHWWPQLPAVAQLITLGCLLVYVVMVSYVTRSLVRNLQVKNDALERLNRTDAGLELPNRRYFERRLELAHKRYQLSGEVACLLLIDVDHFKAVNDQLGHQAGDRLLGLMAEILRHAVRAVDLPARYGGDEFAVLLVRADLGAARQAAQRICSMLAKTARAEGLGESCTLSIGIAEVGAVHVDMREWFNAADAALYRAKGAGRNRIETA